jgi:lipid-binding SYLF domain-containing protein
MTTQTLEVCRPIGRRTLLAVTVGLAAQLALHPAPAWAASQQELTAEGNAALQTLYAESNKATELSKRAKAVLVFPNVRKAGAIVGAQGGQGVLLVNGQPAGFYRISAASVGYQLGAQSFSYALFLVTDGAVAHLKKSNGWALGTGPSLVVVDEGLARSMNTTTLRKDIYAMSFGQKGLMAGAGLEGSKISRITPDP